jgi:7,8-dihydropterin-6-yl-methyl-4-(beta-D-ribofuranosyl)aminobenzene 5'-phosphate synthase
MSVSRATLRSLCVLCLLCSLCLPALSSVACGEPTSSDGAVTTAVTAVTTATAAQGTARTTGGTAPDSSTANGGGAGATDGTATTAGTAATATPQETAASVTSADRAAPVVKITDLYDSHALQSDLQTDYGFACLVEGFDQTVLFDTGADGLILLANMQVLGIAPDDIDAVVLSHEHDDHIGGLTAFLGLARGVTVYYPASFAEDFTQSVEVAGATPVPVETATTICPGLTVTGPLGDSPEELGLVIDTAQGSVLMVGCGHPGVPTMAEAAAALGDGSLFAVLGGFHLNGKSTAEVEGIIDALKQLGVERCGPAHCTGSQATALIKKAFGAGFVQMGVGAVVEF